MLWQDADVTPPSVMQEAQTFMHAFRKRARRDVATSVLMTLVFALITLSARVFWVQVGGGVAAMGSIIGVWWAYSTRPAPVPNGAEPFVVYGRVLDSGIEAAQAAPWWTVLPLVPGTALIGFGLVAATLPLSNGSPFVIGLCVVTLLGLMACWRLMWHTRTQHTAELLARREALNDVLSEEQGR